MKTDFTIGSILIYKEKKIWVAWHTNYMYTGDTLLHLFWKIITEWKSTKHLVG